MMICLQLSTANRIHCKQCLTIYLRLEIHANGPTTHQPLQTCKSKAAQSIKHNTTLLFILSKFSNHLVQTVTIP